MSASPVDLEGHQPRRPTWNCKGCGSPWPCTSARKHLSSLPERRLVAYLARKRALAVAEADLSPAEEHERFTGWIR